MGDIVNAVADVFGFGPASKQAEATESAAETSASASKYAADVQRQMFERQVELQEPWRKAGVNALAQMQGQTNAMPAAFTGQVNLSQDPGYAFRLSEGLKALDRQAAARGGLISGGALKAAQRYGQDMASQEYQNAYNRALTQYNAATQREATGYNRLAALSGIGQTSANQIGSAAGAYGSNIGNLAMTNAANQGNLALARGNIAASQYGTMGSALNTALNTNWNKLGSYFGGGSSGPDVSALYSMDTSGYSSTMPTDLAGTEYI